MPLAEYSRSFFIDSGTWNSQTASCWRRRRIRSLSSTSSPSISMACCKAAATGPSGIGGVTGWETTSADFVVSQADSHPGQRCWSTGSRAARERQTPRQAPHSLARRPSVGQER